MKVVGITGNIGAGKTTVARMFERLGARLIDADQVAREVVRPGTPAWEEILEEFGDEVLRCDGTIDRKRLAAVVFRDETKRRKLMCITHPRIIESIRHALERMRSEGVEVAVVEAALIVEGRGLMEMLDALVVVTADEETQIERLLRNRGLTREEAVLRLKAQMPAEEKARHATYVIDNSGTPEETERRVRAVWEELVSDP